MEKDKPGKSRGVNRMVTLRCTRDLLKLLGVNALETVSEPAAALGDWCARPVSTQAGDFIICISEVTYLSILVPALLYRDLTSFFLMRLAQFLADLGVSEAQAQRECACYQNIIFARTQSRRTLGILNELVFGYQVYAERYPLAEGDHLSLAQRIIATNIYGTPNYIQPDKATVELLGG
jgi:hypothetical protein